MKHREFGNLGELDRVRGLIFFGIEETVNNTCLL